MNSPHTSPRARPGLLYNFLPPFLLFLLVFATFYSPLPGEFLLLDDNEYVTENVGVKGGITWYGLHWAFTQVHSGHWHPLTWISLMVDVELFGETPYMMRNINVLIHATSVALLFFPLLHLLKSPFSAFLVCLIFGVHPLRLESVVWISQRKDVLSFLCFTATLLLYERGVRLRASRCHFLAVILAACGLLAKPTLVTIPVLLMVVDLLRDEGQYHVKSLAVSAVKKWPYWLLSLVSGVGAFFGQTAAGGLKTSDALPLSERLANASFGYVTYLGKLFWPFDLSVFYPLRPVLPGAGVGAWVLLIVVTYVLFQAEREGTAPSRRVLQCGWVWFLVALLPVIGFVQVGWQQVADRWSYIPHLGLLAALVHSMRVSIPAFPRVVNGAFIIVALLFAHESRGSVALWTESTPLFSRALRDAPDNFFIATNLGVAFEKRGDIPNAMRYYREALRVNPEYPLALNNIGVVLAQEGRFSESLPYFSRAIDRHPTFLQARYHLGLALSRIDEVGLALTEWVKVLRMDPNHMATREVFLPLVETLLARGCTGTWDAKLSLEARKALGVLAMEGKFPELSQLVALPCVGVR